MPPQLTRTCLRFGVFLLFLIASSFAFCDENAQPTAAGKLIDGLSTIDPDVYFDMHGNATRQLQALMKMRAAASAEIESEIDKLQVEGNNPKLAAALYHVIGFVKDPGTINWLGQELAAGHKDGFYNSVLPQWFGANQEYYSKSFPIEGREKWLHFLQEIYAKEADSGKREQVLIALSNFDDDVVSKFFEDVRNKTSHPREALYGERYAADHGGVASLERISVAIEELSSNQENRQFLIDMAQSFKHEAFVPFLISVIDDRPGPCSCALTTYAQRALSGITFMTGLKGKRSWQAWYSKHASVGRIGWRDEVITSMRHTLARNRAQARKKFEKGVYSWNDIMFLPFVETELAPRPAFRNEVVDWINLTYTEYYRPRLEVLARQLAKEPASLAPWARNLLIERDFLPGKQKSTWDEVVEFANMRV